MRPTFQAGDLLAGRYRIRESLGTGTVGTVYRAQDTGLNTDVALKIIAQDMLPDATARRAFIQSVRRAQAIDHVNLARILDVRQDGDVALVATQLLEGLTLRRLLTSRREKRHRMPAEEVRPILEQVAEALTTAHPNVCHGCLKPEDIVLLPDHVKLLDLGLAAALPREAFLNAFRMAAGPLAYLAPELRARMPVTPRADVYSLGVVVYEMLTGVAPLEAPLSVRTFDETLPQAFDEIVRRALAVDPAHRYRAPEGLVADFVAVLESRPLGPPPYGPPGVGRSSSGSIIGTPVPPPESETREPYPSDEVREPTDPGMIWPFAEMTPAPAPPPEPPPSSEVEEEVLSESSLLTEESATPAPEPAPLLDEIDRAFEAEMLEPDEVIEKTPLPKAVEVAPNPREEEAAGPAETVIGMPAPALPLARPAESADAPAPTATLLGPPGFVPFQAPASEVPHAEGAKPEPPVIEDAPSKAGEQAVEEPSLAASESPAEPESPPTASEPPADRVAPPAPEASQPPAAPEPPVDRVAPPALEAPEPPPAAPEPVPAPPPVEAMELSPAAAEPPLVAVPPAAASNAPAEPPAAAVTARSTGTQPPTPSRRPKVAILVVGSLALGLIAAGIAHRVRKARLDEEEDERQRRTYQQSVGQERSEPPPAPPPATSPPKTPAPPPPAPKPPGPEQATEPSPTPKAEQLDAELPRSSRRGKCPDGMRMVSSRRRDTYCIDKYEFPGVAKMPRADVSWDQADAACRDRGARLCTASEWNRACRGPGGADYPYGKTWDPLACNTAAADGDERSILPSGAQQECRSSQGVFDMSGNVAEWVDDKSVRGGSAASGAEDSHCASRSSGGDSRYVGFRCCADPQPGE